jgi:flavin-dependent dehydrogenase
MTTDFEVIIVGSGPAGSSTALHLAALDPAMARRTLILEKAVHPRVKLCAGGITGKGLRVLDRLGLPLGVDFLPMTGVEIRAGQRRRYTACPGLGVTIQRPAFDGWLAHKAAERGAHLHEGEGFTVAEVEADRVVVTTAKARYTARALVAADGAASPVRRALGWPPPRHRARLLILDTERGPHDDALRDDTLYLDFAPMGEGIHGYVWDFPTRINGRPFVNRGIYDRGDPESAKGSLKEPLRRALADRGVDLDACHLQGHLERELDPAGPFARPRVLLAGEAAGIDPALGEGIAQALAYGDLAARELLRAARTGDWSFTGYRRRLLRSRLGQELLGTRHLAARLYGPRGDRYLDLFLASARINRLGARFLAGRLHPALLSLAVLPSLAMMPFVGGRVQGRSGSSLRFCI